MDVSVIIPAYNAEATIERAINSVVSQEHAVDEIIVVDDGSSDNTAQIVKSYGSAIRYFHQDNAGVSAARNLGIMNSHCEWIAFLDADDEWLPNWVSNHQHVLGNYTDVTWSFCNFEYAGDDVQRITNVDKAVNCEGAICYFDAQLRGVRLQTSGFLSHRSVFDEVGMFNPEMPTGEDLDLWAKIAMRYPYMGYTSNICYRFWQDNANRLTKTKYPRDHILESISRNVELSWSLGQEVAEAYYLYARKQAMSLILRATAGKVQVSRKVLEEARTIFQLTFREHVLEAVLKVLPKCIARRVVGRLVD